MDTEVQLYTNSASKKQLDRELGLLKCFYHESCASLVLPAARLPANQLE